MINYIKNTYPNIKITKVDYSICEPFDFGTRS